MLKFIVQRLLQAIPVVIITTFVVFMLLRLIPGDPALVLAGPDANQDQVNAIRKDLELDQPVVWQYIVWMKRVVSGDLGRSYILRRPVADLIGRAVPATLQLSLAGVFIALCIGIPFGIIAGLRPNSPWDASLSVLFSLVHGIPMFLMAILYLLIFALLLGWLPPGGRVDPMQDPVNGLRYLLLPTLALALPTSLVFGRFVRTAMVDVFSQDYIRTAYAKGLAALVITTRHALRNALLPLVTIMGVQFSRMLGGTVIVEQVFAWPGMGRLALQALQSRDYILFQAIILLLVLASVVVNLVVDMSYGFLDPRIRERG